MPNSNHANHRRPRVGATLCYTFIASMLAGCLGTPPVAKRPEQPPTVTQALPQPTPPVTVAARPQPERWASATNDREYRKEAANHLYTKNTKRIFPGKMPPLLYAVGVLEVDIDAMGFVSSLRWMRAPSHAPEVIAEIERSIHAAAPFPAPSHSGIVTYTDTWLWHKSGRFQLDTLTLGQL